MPLNIVLMTIGIVPYIKINIIVIFLISSLTAFYCLKIYIRKSLSLFKSFNILFNLPSILNTSYELDINLVIIIILEGDFII